MALKKEEWTVVSDITVRWGDMDAFDHVNNTVYFRYFETARIDYFLKVKWGWIEQKESDGIGPILANTSCQFIQPVRHPHQLKIGVRGKKLGNSSLIQEYEVHSDTLGLVAKGESVVVCYDFINNSKVNFPADLRQRILDVEVLDL
ncbi:MAG: acyl-CoA thioester hydrolase [Maribacter sp.]|jgi:acyl-CoA thioester hydrolase